MVCPGLRPHRAVFKKLLLKHNTAYPDHEPADPHGAAGAVSGSQAPTPAARVGQPVGVRGRTWRAPVVSACRTHRLMVTLDPGPDWGGFPLLDT